MDYMLQGVLDKRSSLFQQHNVIEIYSIWSPEKQGHGGHPGKAEWRIQYICFGKYTEKRGSRTTNTRSQQEKKKKVKW